MAQTQLQVKLLISPILRWSLDLSFMKSIIGFLNNSKIYIQKYLHHKQLIYIESKNVFCCIRRNLEQRMLFLIIGQRFILSQSFNYTPYLFYKKHFKSEINSFWVHIQKELGP